MVNRDRSEIRSRASHRETRWLWHQAAVRGTRSDPKPSVEVNRIGNRSGPDLRSDVPDALTVVWLKRDLRLADHAPFAAAADRAAETKTKNGTETETAGAAGVIVLYLYEPAIYAHPHACPAHLVFINESLAELDRELRERGGRLTTRHGDAVAELARLHATHPFDRLVSHEEVGHAVSYARDRAVKAWCRTAGVAWTEFPHSGVIRGLKSRDGWAKKWTGFMSRPLIEPPAHLPGPTPPPTSAGILSPADLGLPEPTMTDVMTGGAAVAAETLDGFLIERGAQYRTDMSSPVHAWEGCSRMSPYLAYGNVSTRQVYQAAKARAAELRTLRDAGEAIEPAWFGSMKSFESRLRWHCHFIQKFEDEPDIEFHNINRAFDGLRGDRPDRPLGDVDPDTFAAWREGRTGYPLVDACMRCLSRTGWINFRMRAMLASFSSYHLWNHWKAPADFLATRFLDYETGIHFSQFQMQSGVTGINTVRIYSPIKQVKDQDPTGVFIRRWVPELRPLCEHAQVARYLPEPWKMPTPMQRELGCMIGTDYPEPVVDHAEAYRTAKERIYAWRRRPGVRDASEAVFQKHGSRRRRPASPRTSKAK